MTGSATPAAPEFFCTVCSARVSEDGTHAVYGDKRCDSSPSKTHLPATSQQWNESTQARFGDR